MPEEIKQEQVISRDGGQGEHTPGTLPSPLQKPLQDKRILVTRTREQASALTERLRALGAIPVEFPTIQIVPPQDWEPLDKALIRLCAGEVREPYYTWLVFTSANGVKICCERLETLGYNAQAIGSVRVAAIGPATARALTRFGINADLVPGEYIAEEVAAALIADTRYRGETLEGKRVLLARAAGARKVLITELQRAGAVVEEVAAYHTLSAASDDEQGREILRLLQTRQLDFLTFTSSSTVRHFMQWLTEDTGGSTVDPDLSGDAEGECQFIEHVPRFIVESPLQLITHNPQLKIACIGPVTSQTARELGLDVHIEASKFTIDGLVEAIVLHKEKA